MESDNQIIFFLGAEASVPAGLKTVVQLTQYFEEYWLKKECQNPTLLEMIQKIIRNIIEFKNTYYNGKLKDKDDYKVDIELLLETVERLEDYENDILLAFTNNNNNNNDNLIFDENQKQILKRKELSNEIKKFIKSTFIDDMQKIDYLNPLVQFVNYKPLMIFSTNYDLTIERFCFLKGISYTDGFDLYWNKNLFLNSSNGKNKNVNILKLHGSVNWYRTELGVTLVYQFKLKIFIYNSYLVMKESHLFFIQGISYDI